MAAAIKSLGHEIVYSVVPHSHSGLCLPPFSRSECRNRQLHFYCKHLHWHFPLPLSHQFISCHCVKDGGLRREMQFCPLESDFQTASPEKPCERIITWFFTNSISCPQDWGNFTEEKCLHFPVSQKLHLQALLEDVCAFAFIIEMISVLFLDTLMAECGLE